MPQINVYLLKTLSVNWQFFSLYIAGLMMLATALFIARFPAQIDFPVPRGSTKIFSTQAATGEDADAIEKIIPLFQPSVNPVAAARRDDAVLSSDDEWLFSAPASQLPVEVTGLVHSSQSHRSLLIVKIDGRQYSLATGERLPENHAEVVRIFPDRAIIRYQGKYAALKMAE